MTLEGENKGIDPFCFNREVINTLPTWDGIDFIVEILKFFAYKLAFFVAILLKARHLFQVWE